MEISTVDRSGYLSSATLASVRRRLLFALSRFDPKIETVELTVSDVNGPKGGIDKECRILLRLRRGSDIVITDRDTSVAAGVARAVDRAARTLSRRIGRSQDAYRRRRRAVGGL